MEQGFFQTPNKIFNYGLSAQEFIVLSYLIKLSDNNNLCFPSFITISNKCRVSKNSITKIISKLEHLRLISVNRQFHKNNVYRILVTVPKPATQSVPN